MSVSIYHFPTPNGFVSVVGSTNPSPGFSTARLDTLFVTVGGRGMRGPQDGGNVTMRTTATFGTLSPKKKKQEGEEKTSISITGWLLISRILGSQGSSIIHSFIVWSLSRVWLFANLWTIVCRGPLSMGFPRQKYWSGLTFPSPGDLPNTGIEPASPALQADSLPLSHLGSSIPMADSCWALTKKNNKKKLCKAIILQLKKKKKLVGPCHRGWKALALWSLSSQG